MALAQLAAASQMLMRQLAGSSPTELSLTMMGGGGPTGVPVMPSSAASVVSDAGPPSPGAVSSASGLTGTSPFFGTHPAIAAAPAADAGMDGLVFFLVPHTQKVHAPHVCHAREEPRTRRDHADWRRTATFSTVCHRRRSWRSCTRSDARPRATSTTRSRRSPQ